MPTLLKTKRLGWAVIFVIVTLMGLIAHLSGRRYLAAVQAVEHTLSVKSAISGTLSLLKDAETGQRGFILTGDEQFLEPYRDAREHIPPLLARLDTITRADAAQNGRLQALNKLIALKYTFIEETISSRREGDLPHALELVRGGMGKPLMDQIRASCRRMLDAEELTLAARKLEAQHAEQAAIVGVGVGSALTILLALFSLLTVNRDVGDLRRAAEELAKSEGHYRLLTEQSSDLVRLLNLSGATTYVSPSVERILGYTVEEYAALAPMSLMHPDELEIAHGMLRDVKDGKLSEGIATYRLRHKAGEFRWFEVRWAVLRGPSGAVRELHTTARDVSERRHAEEQLSRHAEQLRSLSLRDELTGLYNRRGFLEVAGHAHAQAVRDGRPAALLFADLNGMKSINDELGHDAGDDALVDAACVLKAALREADVIGRLGGDEFVAFVVDLAPSGLDQVRRRLRELADARVKERARPFRLSISSGGAFLLSGAHTSLGELLEQADDAMYEQKNSRRARGGVSLLPPASTERDG